MQRSQVTQAVTKFRILFVAIFVCLVAARPSPGQSAPIDGPVTIQQAIEQAVKNYPSVRAGLTLTAAEESGIELARTAYLPKADFYYQPKRLGDTKQYLWSDVFQFGDCFGFWAGRVRK